MNISVFLCAQLLLFVCLGYKIEPAQRKRVDILINHAIYTPSMLRQKMTPGYKLVVPTRDPVSWFKSATAYYSVASHTNAVSSPGTYYTIP